MFVLLLTFLPPCPIAGKEVLGKMSEKIPIKIKWVKEKYDVEIMLDEPVEVFKTQVGVTHAFSNHPIFCPISRCDTQQEHKAPF
jgi:hypothetical protein